MQPNVQLRKIRNVSEIIDDSALFVKQNYKQLSKAYFTICGFFWVATMVVSIFYQLQPGAGDGVYFLLFCQFLNFTVITITGISYIAVYNNKDNQPPDLAEVWGYFKYYFFRVLGCNILLVICLAIGTVCCFFPGVYLFPILSLVPVIMIIDNGSISYSFSHSFKIIKNNWGPVFGVILMGLLLVFAVTILCGIPVSIIAGTYVFLRGHYETEVLSISTTVTFHIAQFAYLFILIALSLAYFNLKEHDEDHNLFERIKQFGRNVTVVNPLSEEEEY